MPRRSRDDEPAFVSPEEDPSIIQQPTPPKPEGPSWWHGHWPENGIRSLQDLMVYVEQRRERMVEGCWTGIAGLKKLELGLGRQAVDNAHRYLERHSTPDRPVRPSSAALQDLRDIERALDELLDYLRGIADKAGRVGQTPATAEPQGAVMEVRHWSGLVLASTKMDTTDLSRAQALGNWLA